MGTTMRSPSIWCSLTLGGKFPRAALRKQPLSRHVSLLVTLTPKPFPKLRNRMPGSRKPSQRLSYESLFSGGRKIAESCK